jgi:PAS domain S-box-containing protein
MSADSAKLFKYDKALAVALIYAIFSSGWIFLSDELSALLFRNQQQLLLVSISKGWVFVLLSSLFIYGLLRRCANYNKFTVQIRSSTARPFGLAFLVVSLLIVLIAGGLFFDSYQHFKATEIARLQASNQLKAKLISNWLQERQSDAEFIQSSDFTADRYSQWQTNHDAASGEVLKSRLTYYCHTRGCNAVAVFNPAQDMLWSSGDSGFSRLPSNVLNAIQKAVTQRSYQPLEPFLDDNRDLQMVYATPLLKIVGQPAVVVLLYDVEKWLKPTLQIWPAVTATSETLLFKLQSGRIVYLNKLPGQATVDTQPTQEIDGLLNDMGASGNNVQEGLDYRGVQTLNIYHVIPGTDWYLLSKVDLAEIHQAAKPICVLIVLSGLMTLLMSAASFYLFWQRQELVLSQAVRQAQADRLKALNLLSSIADSSDDAIFAKDLSGNYVLFNQAGCKIVGKPLEEVLGDNEFNIFPAEQAGYLFTICQQVLIDQKSGTFEQELDTCDGKRIFLITKGPMFDAEGVIIGTFGMAHDITQRYQAEAALAASEFRYRNLFDNMLNGYAYCRMLFENGQPVDFIYLSVNRAFEKLTGLKDVVGCRVSELIPGILETDPGLIAQYARVALNGQPEQIEVYIVAMQQWFLLSVFCPEAEHFVAIFDEITERKQAEICLKTSEQRLHLALEATRDGLWDWDIQQDVSYLSPRYYEMTGYKADEVKADLAFFRLTVHPDDWPQVIQTLQDHLQGKSHLSEIDYRLVTASGSIKWIRGRGRVVERNSQGEPLRMIGLITDITTRKEEKNAMLAQTQQLAERNVALERFNRAAVGRELDMIELKKQINALCNELGRPAPFALAFLE